MAKNPKKPKDRWEKAAETESISQYDGLMEKLTENAKKHYPGEVYTGGEAAQRVLCLPVPALSVRFLIQQEGWPLERFTQIVGPRASGKSSLGYEIIHWHRRMAGNGIIVQVEPKPAPELMLAFFQWDDKTALMQEAHESIGQWYDRLRYWIGACRTAMDGTKKDPGKGRVFPVCFMVDSLTAVLDANLRAKFETGDSEEALKKHYATQASQLTDIMKFLPGELVGYPFSWLGINHVKEGTKGEGQMQRTVRTVPGGQALQYGETLEIEVTRRGKIKRADETGYEVRLEMIKNSLAPEQWVDVDKVGWIDLDDRDPKTGHCRNKMMWDWHKASIDVLDQISKNAGARIKRALDDLLGLKVTDGRVSCAALDIPENKKVDMRKAGELLEGRLQADPKLCDELYPLVGIRRRQLFRKGVDYVQQIKDAMSAGLQADVDRPEEEQPIPGGET
jgi:RecA/RadA recombinase